MAELRGEPGAGSAPSSPAWVASCSAGEPEPRPGCAQHPSPQIPWVPAIPEPGLPPRPKGRAPISKEDKAAASPGAALLPPREGLGAGSSSAAGCGRGSALLLFPAAGMCHSPKSQPSWPAWCPACASSAGCARSPSICKHSPCQRLGRVGH